MAAGIPKSNFWASDPNGINQVGCVYTAQGFEFDYVGVITIAHPCASPKLCASAESMTSRRTCAARFSL